jgi:hypothetical protein
MYFRVNDEITAADAAISSLTGDPPSAVGRVVGQRAQRGSRRRRSHRDASNARPGSIDLRPARDLGTLPPPSRHTLRATCHAVAGTVERVQPTPRHRELEARFLALVDESELPSPDRVEYERESVLFLWDGPRVAVFVDFDGGCRSPPGSAG